MSTGKAIHLKDHFTRLVTHLEWADERVLESLRSAANAPAKALDLYAHILGSEHTWVSRIRGTTTQLAVWPNLTLDDCARIGKGNAASLRTLVSALSDESFAEQITYRNSAGELFTSTLEDILTHVMMHGSYHRGQIASLIRAAGDTPSPTDYIAFARGSPAATRQS
jgi:uncharacterized damage-inducible protein DinB